MGASTILPPEWCLSRICGLRTCVWLRRAYETAFTGSLTSTAVQAIDPTSLAVRWTFQEPGASKPAVGSTPLLADGYVFAEGSQGDVWALDPCSGTVAWQTQVSPFPQSAQWAPLPSLAAGDGYLVVPTADGLAAFQGKRQPHDAGEGLPVH